MRHWQKLLLLTRSDYCSPLTCMSLSASVRQRTLLAISLPIANTLSCLLVVCAQWNRSALLVAAQALPLCPSCPLQQLVTYVAGSNLRSESVGAWLCTSVPYCDWHCICLSNVLSKSCHNPTFPERPMTTPELQNHCPADVNLHVHLDPCLAMKAYYSTGKLSVPKCWYFEKRITLHSASQALSESLVLEQHWLQVLLQAADIPGVHCVRQLGCSPENHSHR